MNNENSHPLQGNPLRRNVLIVDDTPRYAFSVLRPKFEAEYFDFHLARTMREAYELVSDKGVAYFSLAVVDVHFDDPAPRALSTYVEALANRNKSNGHPVEMNGQVLGLWLWAERQTLRLPYCYLTSYPHPWVAKLPIPGDKEDVDNNLEFKGHIGVPLLFARGTEPDGPELFKEVTQFWERHGFLPDPK